MVRPGLDLLSEQVGSGLLVERHAVYRFRLRMWLHGGDPVRWSTPWGDLRDARLEDDGAALTTELRVDRVQMFSGLFYGVQGMRVGGRRLLRVAPHLAYRETGVPGCIPPNALLTVEVEVLGSRDGGAWRGTD
jgi:hypothetical protein